MIRRLALLCIVGTLAGCTQTTKPQRVAKIGTGTPTSVYQTTGALIAMITRGGLSGECVIPATESTPGSVYNINSVINGEISVGIASGMDVYSAMHGSDNWSGQPQEELRTVCNLGLESVVLATAHNSSINFASDLRGKRIGLNTSSRNTVKAAQEISTHAGLSSTDYTIVNTAIGNPGAMIAQGQMDAYIAITAEPHKAAGGNVRAVPITGTPELIRRHPYYVATRVSMQDPTNTTRDRTSVESVGIRTVLVTSSKTNEAVVYGLARSIMANRNQLDASLTDTMTPLHNGAARALREIR